MGHVGKLTVSVLVLIVTCEAFKKTKVDVPDFSSQNDLINAIDDDDNVHNDRFYKTQDSHAKHQTFANNDKYLTWYLTQSLKPTEFQMKDDSELNRKKRENSMGWYVPENQQTDYQPENFLQQKQEEKEPNHHSKEYGFKLWIREDGAPKTVVPSSTFSFVPIEDKDFSYKSFLNTLLHAVHDYNNQEAVQDVQAERKKRDVVDYVPLYSQTYYPKTEHYFYDNKQLPTQFQSMYHPLVSSKSSIFDTFTPETVTKPKTQNFENVFFFWDIYPVPVNPSAVEEFAETGIHTDPKVNTLFADGNIIVDINNDPILIDNGGLVPKEDESINMNTELKKGEAMDSSLDKLTDLFNSNEAFDLNLNGITPHDDVDYADAYWKDSDVVPEKTNIFDFLDEDYLD